MQKPVCIFYIIKLELRWELLQITQELGIESYFATLGEQLYQLVKTWVPFTLVVDLTGADSDWIFKHIGTIEFFFPGFPIVAIIPDYEEQMRQRAESYGCRHVLTKTEFQNKIKTLLEAILQQKA